MLDPGNVYKLNGEVLLYVRTEKRSGDSAPHHLFVTTRNRVVFNLWLPELPEAAELVIDEGGRKLAQEAQVELQIERWDKELAYELLAKAGAWLPKERYEQLKQEYLDRRLYAEAA